MKPKLIEITAGNPDQIRSELARQLGTQPSNPDIIEIPEAWEGYLKIAPIDRCVLVTVMEQNESEG